MSRYEIVEVQGKPRVLRQCFVQGAAITTRGRRCVRRDRRLAVFARDGYRCHYCGKAVVLKEVWERQCDRDAATVDHVIAHAKGGGNGLANLVTACYPCNHAKGSRGWPGMPKNWPPTLATLAEVWPKVEEPSRPPARVGAT